MQAKEWNLTVNHCKPLSEGYFLLSLRAPKHFPEPLPGQFLMISTGKEPALLLRRPMAVMDFEVHDHGIDLTILFNRVGKGTDALAAIAEGQVLSTLGPLGNAFSMMSKDELFYVIAGGIGVAPFYLWLKQHSPAIRKQAKVILGFRSSKLSTITDLFRTLSENVTAVYQDQTPHNVVDEFLKHDLKTPNFKVLTCGPEPMLLKMVDLSAQKKFGLEASWEAKMGCGIGACLSCILPNNRGLLCQQGAILTF